LWAGDGRQADVEVVFGPAGFGKNFSVGSRVLSVPTSDASRPQKGDTGPLDFWKSHREFEVFRERFAAEYELNRFVSTEGYVHRQVVGSYERKRWRGRRFGGGPELRRRRRYGEGKI
jgi:hypothetical protein